MTAPKRAVTGKEGRYYPDPDDRSRKLKSVTTHNQNLPKPFLVPWAAREVARFALPFIEDGMCATAEGEIVKKRTYRGERLKGADLEKFLKTEWKRQRDDAAELGDKVHSNAEEILNTYFLAPEGIEPVTWLRDCASDFLLALEERSRDGGVTADEYIRTANFVKWLHSYHVEPLFVEPEVYNSTIGYAGSCDLFAVVDGIPTVIDFKTSRSLHAEVALQLSAYANGEYLLTEDDERFPVPHVERGAALHITNKGAFFTEVEIGADVFEVYKHLVAITYGWVDDLSKRALLSEIPEQPIPFEDGGDGE